MHRQPGPPARDRFPRGPAVTAAPRALSRLPVAVGQTDPQSGASIRRGTTGARTAETRFLLGRRRPGEAKSARFVPQLPVQPDFAHLPDSLASEQQCRVEIPSRCRPAPIRERTSPGSGFVGGALVSLGLCRESGSSKRCGSVVSPPRRSSHHHGMRRLLARGGVSAGHVGNGPLRLTQRPPSGCCLAPRAAGDGRCT